MRNLGLMVLATFPLGALAGCGDSPVNDRGALAALYHATGGPDWERSDNWLTNAPLSEWYGVAVDSAGRVEQLDLSNNDLRGPIPPEIGNLAALEGLDLSDNGLSGPIPLEMARLAALRQLELDSGSQSGLCASAPRLVAWLATLDVQYLPHCR